MATKEQREKSAEYNREYYKQNKVKIRSQRKDKNQSNATHRKKIIQQSRKYYNTYKKSPSAVRGYTIKKINGIEVFTIKYLAEVLQYSASALRKFEEKGILPISSYTDRRGWRYYSTDQIELCIKAFGERRACRWTDAEVTKFLNNFWYIEGKKTNE